MVIQKINFPSAITCEFSGGRFGDNLTSYLHAKWISYKYNIPIRYKPFTYSNQLVLHQEESHFDLRENFDQIIILTNDISIEEYKINKNILFVVPFFPECLSEYIRNRNQYKFHCIIDWNDPIFVNEVRKLIYPIKKLNLLSLPTDKICVAMHLRRGGDFDRGGCFDLYTEKNQKVRKTTTSSYIAAPLKTAPDSFYIKQLRIASQFFNNAPLYVYIFTDDKNPKIFADKYTAELKLSNITFDYRKEKNTHNLNVLEDFFSMMKFNVMIRPESNFSIVASRLANQQLTFYPISTNFIDYEVIRSIS